MILRSLFTLNISRQKRAIILLYKPRHAKPCLRAYGDTECPDQSVHSRSLIRAFSVRKQNYWILQNVWMESKGPDVALRMHRMTWSCAICAYLKVLCLLSRPAETLPNNLHFVSSPCIFKAGQISCSAELSMKQSFNILGARFCADPG